MKPNKVKFGQSELKQFYNLLEWPDIPASDSTSFNYAKYAYYFINDLFECDISKQQLNKLGIFLKSAIDLNEKNYNLLNKALERVFLISKKKHDELNKLNESVSKIKESLYEQNALDKRWVKGDALDDLTPEALRWNGKIKLIGLKSFKTAWFPAVSERRDIVYTDEIEDKSRIKHYFNKPIFSVPEMIFRSMKRRYEEFQPGLHEYIQYLFYKIEQMKNRTSPGFVADRTIFMVTSSPKFDEIDVDKNLLAIHTNGNDRPTYKGLPEFLNPQDFDRIKTAMSQNNSPLPQAATGI